jgi:predicted RNA-binding protein (virulence factor B family)
VDDCLFICTRDDKSINEQIIMLNNAFEEVTVEAGDELGLVRMHICMDQKRKQVVIMQPKHVERIIEKFDMSKGAPTPALGKLMGDEINSPLFRLYV